MTLIRRCAIITAAVALGALTSISAAAPIPAVQDAPPGKAPYDRVCEQCHGPDGKGDVGPSLVPMERGEDEVLGIVRSGNGEMPPIPADTISDDEVKAVVAYLKSIQ